VAARSQGRASYYSLARPELLDLLRSAERLLESTGAQVRLCPNYGQDTGSDAGEGDALAVMAMPAPAPAVTLSAIDAEMRP
jgi:hypothetical protein